MKIINEGSYSVFFMLRGTKESFNSSYEALFNLHIQSKLYN